MKIEIEIPDAIANQLRESGTEISRVVLEYFVLEAYRSGNLDLRAACKILGLKSEEEFLALAGNSPQA
jgi:hypothetical protein